MNVHLNSERASWDSFVLSHPGSTNYHQYGWRNVIERSFGHKTHYLTAVSDEGEIRGILPLTHMKSVLFGSFLVSLPFLNYGGMLFADDAAGSALLGYAREMLRKCRANHVELRHLQAHGNGLITRQHKVTMLLDLQNDPVSQWNAFGPKVRNQIRKAEKSELRAVMGQIELLDGFYQVFCRNMRDLGTPVYSRNFFRNVMQTFPETTRIVSVLSGEKTIASGLLIWYRDILEVPWASSIRDFRELCPNNLLYWKAIKFAIDAGARRFDFGRSTPDEGTYRFKKQWGATPAPLYWQYLLKGKLIPELNNKNPKFQKMIRVWQRLPVSFTRILGPHIVRCIP